MAPFSDFGRSRTWPTDARTVYPAPKYFSIVFAFAGDSTITSVVLMTSIDTREMILCQIVTQKKY